MGGLFSFVVMTYGHPASTSIPPCSMQAELGQRNTFAARVCGGLERLAQLPVSVSPFSLDGTDMLYSTFVIPLSLWWSIASSE